MNYEDQQQIGCRGHYFPKYQYYTNIKPNICYLPDLFFELAFPAVDPAWSLM